MTIKVAINGHGRIDRNILRAHDEGGRRHDLQIVAAIALDDAKISAGLTQHDSAHGRFSGTMVADGYHEDIRCARHPRAPCKRRLQARGGFEHLRHVARQGVGAARQSGGLVRRRVGLHSPHARHHRCVADGHAKRAST